MSVMEYDFRRYPSHGLSYPNNYYNYDPLSIQHNSRSDPRGYPIGGPVGGRGRPGVGREESVMENGPARRRIAVACARCRKRKIRCSGDSGTGAGCSNCRQAGLDPSVCQFHRVGSNDVHKFHDVHIAHGLAAMSNSNGMMPMYPTTTSSHVYGRSMPPTYPQLDTKSMYASTWAGPYSEETSPVETYGLEQPAAAYLPTPTPIATSSSYGPSYRWTYPTAKPLQHAATYYNQDSGYVTHGLPYMQNSNLRTPTTSEAISPLSMTSLSLTLPERPRPRQYHLTDGAATQRQLPMPQPSPAQTSRNVVDQLQDQRLRSGQTSAGTSAGSMAAPPFSKSLSAWGASNEDSANVVAATSGGVTTQMPTTSESAMNYLAATSMPGDTTSAGTASQVQLNFSSSSLLDTLDAPAPTPTYSTFREHRTNSTNSAQLARHSSQSNIYGWGTDSTLKRNSLGESNNNFRLLNGQRYTPLPHQPQPASSAPEGMQRESFESRAVPIHRSSMGQLNSSF